MEQTIGFIGAGNMAGAIISGILNNDKGCRLYAYDIDRSKCERFGERVDCCASIREMIETCDCLFLAVKPQVISRVLIELSEYTVDWSKKVFVTMVAGISTDYIASHFQGYAPAIVRIMPNTPMMLGYGATGICANKNATDEQVDMIKALLSGAGVVCDVPEHQMNASISINGSSPAYIFLFAKAVMDYAKSEGINEDDALTLFSNTLIGSAHMLMESHMDPQSLIDMVTSPGGTTQEALRVFHEKQFCDIVGAAMAACTKRANELSQ